MEFDMKTIHQQQEKKKHERLNFLSSIVDS